MHENEPKLDRSDSTFKVHPYLRLLNRRIDGSTSCVLFWTILIVGFASRMALVAVLQPYARLERFEMELAAISLARTGVLGNTYAIPTGPSAHIAPVYATLLALIFTVFGTGIQGELAKVTVSTLLSVVPYALFPKLAETLGLGKRLGFWSGFIASLIPLKPGSDLLGDWEAPAAAALLVFCLIQVAKVWRGGRMSTPEGVRHGLSWGIALLTAPAFLTIYVATLLAGALLSSRNGIAGYLRFAGVQTFCVGCMLAPWIIRNYLALGSPVVTRSNMGLELRLSNNDFASPNEMVNFRAGLYHRYHPLQNAEEARKLRDLGEMEFNRQATNAALSWMRAHPAEFLELSLKRALLFWFPKSDPIRSLIFSFLSVASFAGVILLFRRDAVAALVLALPLLIQPLPHYLVHVNVRHKYPIDWIGVIGVAIVLQWALRLAARNDLRDRPGSQVVPGKRRASTARWSATARNSR